MALLQRKNTRPVDPRRLNSDTELTSMWFKRHPILAVESGVTVTLPKPIREILDEPVYVENVGDKPITVRSEFFLDESLGNEVQVDPGHMLCCVLVKPLKNQSVRRYLALDAKEARFKDGQERIFHFSCRLIDREPAVKPKVKTEAAGQEAPPTDEKPKKRGPGRPRKKDREDE